MKHPNLGDIRVVEQVFTESGWHNTRPVTAKGRPIPREEFMRIWENIVAKNRVSAFVERFVRAIEARHGIHGGKDE